MWKVKTLGVVLLALLGCSAHGEEWPGYKVTPETDFSYGRAASPSRMTLVIEHRQDPLDRGMDRLFQGLVLAGQRRHEERMLRLMFELSASAPPATSTPPPTSSTAAASSRQPRPPAATPTVTSPDFEFSADSGLRSRLRAVCPSCPIR